MKRTGLTRKTPISRTGNSIRSVTPKTAARNRRYSKERADYLGDEGRPCEHAFEGICTGWSQQIDHRVARSRDSSRVDDPTNFIASCVACHTHRENDLTREQREELNLGRFADQQPGRNT